MKVDFEEIRLRHPLAEYCLARGIDLKRCGSVWVARCPLHSEKNASFTVYRDEHWNCFGCQEHGDVVDLEMALSRCTRRDAIERLGGANPAPISSFAARPITPEAEKKIWFPELQSPTKADLTRLSVSRSIDIAPLVIAVSRGLLWCFDDTRNGRCWLYTDQTRRCGIRRRLDGKPFKLSNGSETKSAACPGSNMRGPIGCQEARDFPCISVQEGAPDSLAAIAHTPGHRALKRG
jgi:CHC2 zinc finger